MTSNIDIYTTPFCPFCTRAKSLLEKKGAHFNEIEAGMNADLRDQMLARSNGARTFPQIFIGDSHIGGCDDLYALESMGGLDPLLGT